jgi:hypothetical protein
MGGQHHRPTQNNHTPRRREATHAEIQLEILSQMAMAATAKGNATTSFRCPTAAAAVNAIILVLINPTVNHVFRQFVGWRRACPGTVAGDVLALIGDRNSVQIWAKQRSIRAPYHDPYQRCSQ